MIQIPTDRGPLFLNMERVVAVQILEPEGRWEIRVIHEGGNFTATLTEPTDDQVNDTMSALWGDGGQS